MKLDEAIKHAEEVAEQNEWFEKNHLENKGCKECAKEHRQLAEWLKDYKRLKEQEPCEDAISRQAVLEFIGKQIDHSLWAFEKLVNGIKDLPSVTPQAICPSHGVDCKDCPAINGEWVAKPDGRFIYAQCSKCGEIHDVASNYCPSCGCIMDKNDFNAYIKAESEE